MEVCIDNLESAINAERGGAIRLELCSALSDGGLTPSVGFLRIVKQKVKIPVFVMIRPRSGDFIYSEDEIEIMSEDMKILQENGADGFVFGITTSTGKIDIERCSKLMKLAGNHPVTFHRAFDTVKDPLESLEEIISLGFQRILTSGLQASASLGTSLLRQLIDVSKGRIIIMPGAGIKPDNLHFILKETNPVEFHGSAKAPKKDYFISDENAVREMVTLFKSMYGSEK
ncbi:copper homeostasis protein cutC homolog isoform X2 [Halyomorpha halys]|uniref:copper homeostasis protein cutC homolog isoform X2 n=1 Tax=Halyomorpha halys TaxID=286706 RepID=UPI0006D5194C|nr:copper homeostasis protein cutC homolog isoform X2 [Halyomorpha halys]